MALVKPISLENFTGGLSLVDVPKDSQFTVLRNFFYNADKRVQTRRGYKKFGNPIGVNPISSYFFYQRDDN